MTVLRGKINGGESNSQSAHPTTDVIERVPKLANIGAHTKQQMREKLLEHQQYICEFGDDLPEIKNWKWTY